MDGWSGWLMKTEHRCDGIGVELLEKFKKVCVLLLLVLLLAPNAKGVPQNVFGPIVLGQTCALSGPAENLGLEMRSGLLAAFGQVNDNGGIHGREIILISLDDGYEPDKAVKNTRSLIYDDQVFALIGAVGTPTAKSVEEIFTKAQIPFFGPVTGAEFLRHPYNRYVVNVRASYYQEMARLVSYLVDEKKIKRIACFYQNDSYGYAGLEGIKRTLEKRSMSLVAKGSYERNTVAVMGALRDINKGRPEAVIMVGAYSACAEFIKLSKNKYDNDLVYCNISFVGTESLSESLGGYGESVVVSQVIPSPRSKDISLTREYKQAMAKYQHDAPISFTSFEGFIVGKLFSKIALSVTSGLTRERFLTAMEKKGRFDLGGLALEYGIGDNQGLDDIYLTEIYPDIHQIQGPQ